MYTCGVTHFQLALLHPEDSSKRFLGCGSVVVDKLLFARLSARCFSQVFETLGGWSIQCNTEKWVCSVMQQPC